MILAEAGPHQTGFHGGPPIAERDRSRHAGAGNDDDEDRVTDEHGRILRDNAYGNIDDDVWRRDFTANSLYYNIADFSIWDYTGGVADIAARRLKLIGDPVTRYREDPVRMLRAARFEAKLGFTLDGNTGTAIAGLKDLLGSVPPARLFDETLKLFLTGHGARSLEVLRARGLLAELLPTVASYLQRHPDGAVARLLKQGLINTDQRVAQGKPVTPTFLFALLLYGPIAEIIEKQPPGEMARHRHHCRCRGPRGARRAGPHHHPEAFFAGCARNVRRATAPRAAARPACAAHAGAAALPRRIRSAAAARRHGPGAARHRRLVDTRAGSLADRSRSHGGCARRAATCRRGRRTTAAAPSPPAWARASARHHMNAATDALAGAAAALRWQPAYVGVGSNLAEPRAQVQRALEALGRIRDSRLVAASPLYQTPPLGEVVQPPFVNAVAGLLTRLSPEELLAELRRLERELGREPPRERWGPRIIDLDLLVLRPRNARHAGADAAAPGHRRARLRALSTGRHRAGPGRAGSRQRGRACALRVANRGVVRL